MSRLLVDDVTKTDARALLNVNKMATISDIVAPSNEYIYASGANELTVVEGCVIAVGGAGIFKTARAGRTQQASWGRLRRWKMQRALARRVILYMMITARRYIPQRGSRQAQAFRLAYR